ncbi:hypothetical protein ACSLBF_13085 [Pseudoalteromonas sp. T1lg65]|uniref:hypothetical protein n=1 Tax=Pseudoalteromonas sp. T1lg65 TaxID=2077101 RepID=UPI003F7A0E51
MLKTIILTLMMCFSAQSLANIAIIAHPSFSQELDKNYIKRIFLGKEQLFPSGDKVMILEIDNEDKIYESFCQHVVDKQPERYKAFMARLIFTGKVAPLKRVASSQEMKQLVVADTSTIGYIPVSEVDDSIKVLATF